MTKQIFSALLLGCPALLLASCAARDEPKHDAPPAKSAAVETPAKNETPAQAVAVETPVKKETPPAKPDLREVTLLVDGMSDRLKLV
jgi:hypothetical protein